MKFQSVLLVFSLLILGCSSDDSNTDDATSTGNYFPSSINDSWTYAVENASTTNPELNFNETDVVTINSVSDEMFTIEVNDGSAPANGTMNSIFGTGTFTKTNTNLVYTGDLSVLSEIDVIAIPDIDLTDFILYDTNATSNSQLFITSDSFTQDVDLEEQTLPVTSTYQITNTHITNLSSLTVNDNTYNNVIHTEIRLNLEISTVINIGFPITQSILDPQDVMVIHNYYAENVGLIKSEAHQSFEISAAFIAVLNTVGVATDFPANSSVDNIQELESYNVQNYTID